MVPTVYACDFATDRAISLPAPERNKRNVGAIFALNFLLGWTLVGWVVALVWALSHDVPTAIMVKSTCIRYAGRCHSLRTVREIQRAYRKILSVVRRSTYGTASLILHHFGGPEMQPIIASPVTSSASLSAFDLADASHPA